MKEMALRQFQYAYCIDVILKGICYSLHQSALALASAEIT